MIHDSEDIGLRALLDTARTVAPNIPEAIIRDVYAIEMKHQFEKDREIPMNEIRRTIDSLIAKDFEDQSK